MEEEKNLEKQEKTLNNDTQINTITKPETQLKSNDSNNSNDSNDLNDLNNLNKINKLNTETKSKQLIKKHISNISFYTTDTKKYINNISGGDMSLESTDDEYKLLLHLRESKTGDSLFKGILNKGNN